MRQFRIILFTSFISLPALANPNSYYCAGNVTELKRNFLAAKAPSGWDKLRQTFGNWVVHTPLGKKQLEIGSTAGDQFLVLIDGRSSDVEVCVQTSGENLLVRTVSTPRKTFQIPMTQLGAQNSIRMVYNGSTRLTANRGQIPVVTRSGITPSALNTTN